MRTLREYQVRAIEAVRNFFVGGLRKLMLQLPTGAGKTLIAANIITMARQKNKRVIFVVPYLSLINQTVEEFYAEGIHDIGVIQGNHPLTNYAMPVQIASIQTLQNRKIPHADLVIIDEAHVMYKFVQTWMEEWNATYFIGLTATPWSKGLGKFYEALHIATTTKELIEQDYLSDFVAYGPSKPDMTGVRTRAGDYVEEDLERVCNTDPLVGNIVDNWIENGEGRPTICFAVNCAHAKHIQREFLAKGVAAEYIDAYTKTEEREGIAKRFHSGTVQVVCNVGTLIAGIDWDVRCIIFAVPTKSESKFVQCIGRGLRKADGKDICKIFDHSDTHERLGYVTDIHHETLCDGKPKKSSGTSEKRESLPKLCANTECNFLKPPKVHKCPACGFAPEKQSEIETVEGQLIELKRKKKTNRDLPPEEKEKFFGELKGYADQKKYKPGWAAHAYKEKFGVWPNAHKNAPVLEPSATTLGFIKHLHIKKAKSQSGRKYA